MIAPNLQPVDPAHQNPYRIYVVILCWNGKRWLKACLSSLFADQATCPYEILVVDNGSTDGSASWIRDNFPTTTVIETGKNLGFAGGNNVGIEYARQKNATHILLLNQDTVVFEGWMQTLIAISKSHPQYGILSPFQYNYEGLYLDRVFETQLRAHTPYFEDNNQHCVKPVYDIPQVIGAAMLLRSDLLKSIGNFDPFYFLYFEEKDLCRRALSAGYHIGVVPAGKIGHYHGQLHAEELKIADVDGFFLRNRQIFILKDPNQSFIKNLYVFLRYGLPNSLRRKYDSPVTPPNFKKALLTQLEVLFNLPRIFLRRHWECAQIKKHLNTKKL